MPPRVALLNWFRGYARFVSGIYELGAIGDSGRPDLKPIFAPRADTAPARKGGFKPARPRPGGFSR